MFGEGLAIPTLLLIVWIPRLLFGLKGLGTDSVALTALAPIVLVVHVNSLSLVIQLTALALFAITTIVLYPLLCLSLQAIRIIDFPADGLEPLRPRLIPCRTSHKRLFPQKHGFSYNYLQVGMPVGFGGNIASTAAADPGSEKEHQLFRGLGLAVRAEDHLSRGHRHIGLRGKLDMYIRDQARGSSSITDHQHLHVQG